MSDPQPTIAERYGVTDPEMAKAMNEAAADDNPAPIRKLGDYLAAPIKSPPELVSPRFLVRGGVTAVVADAGKGKTSLGLNRVLSWAAGKPLFKPVTKWGVPSGPLRTLIIENEGAGGLFQEKIQTMLVNAPKHFTKDDIAAMQENVLVWGEGGYAGIKLDDPRKLAQVRRGIDEWRPDIVLMEPFARLHAGDENSNTEVNALMSTLEELAGKTDTGILVAHHKRKSREYEGDPMEDARGASALYGAATYMEKVKPIRAGKQRELICTKNRYGPMLPPVVMEWREDNTGWYDFVPRDASLDELIALLSPDESVTAKELAEDLQDDEKRVRNMLNSALAQDPPRVRRIGGHGQGYGWLLATADNDYSGGPRF